MSMKQKLYITTGLENYFPYHYALYDSAFWAPIGHPIAHLTWGLIDLKLFPLKGLSKKEVQFFDLGNLPTENDMNGTL